MIGPTKLIADADKPLYRQYLEGTTTENLWQRIEGFYAWARAKGYQLHQENPLARQQNTNNQTTITKW